MSSIGMNDSGMSLLEIMVAMILFAVGLLSLGTLIPHSTKKLVNAGARTTSVTIAQGLIDEVSTKAFDEKETDGSLSNLTNVLPTDMTAPASMGPDAAETQATYDDVDDYKSLVLDPVPGTLQYKAEVDVKYCDASGDTTATAQSFYKRIMITVTPKGGREPIMMSTVISFKG